MLSYAVYRLFGWLAPRLPPWVGYRMFERLGTLFYALDRRSREAVYSNLRHVLGAHAAPETLDALVRRVFQNQAYNYFDLFHLPALEPQAIEERVILNGWHHLEEAYALGRGVIIVSAHFGNVDVALQILGIRGLRALVVMEHLQPDALYRYVVRLRGRFGAEIIPVDGALKKMFRTLRDGNFVILTADRDVTHSGEVVEFFGAPARLPDGYARISQRTGAPILPAFTVRLPDHRIRSHIEPPFMPPQTGNREADVRAIMQHVVRVMERYICAYPDQWVMFRPIWSANGGRPPAVSGLPADGRRLTAEP